MAQFISLMALVVPDYDSGIDFYTKILGFTLLEDTDRGGGKRWVRVAPEGAQTALLLAKAVTDVQTATIGNQTGGRVFLFLETDDFERDYALYKKNGVTFLESPRKEEYGTVVVMQDPFGNKWDLIQRAFAEE